MSKFALIFFIGKFLKPSDLGLYGIFSATLLYAIFIIGFEFYTYSTRSFISANPFYRQTILRNIFVFYIFVYVFILPLFLLVFIFNFLPWSLIYWFYILLPFEHISQEINRYLIALSMQLEASIVLFLRSGLWCLITILLLWYVPFFRNISFILSFWCIGSFASLIIGILFLRKGCGLPTYGPVDWNWITKGIKVALFMLIGVISIRGLLTFDKYLVGAFGNSDILGAYVLYANLSTSVISFLDAGVVVFFYPKLISAAKHNTSESFDIIIKSLSINIFVVTCLLTIFAYLFGIVVIEWINKPTFQDNFYLFKWLLISTFIYGISHIPHMALYAKDNDGPIVFSQLFALIFFLLISYILGHQFGAKVIPISLSLSFTFILIWKTVKYKCL